MATPMTAVITTARPTTDAATTTTPATPASGDPLSPAAPTPAHQQPPTHFLDLSPPASVLANHPRSHSPTNSLLLSLGIGPYLRRFESFTEPPDVERQQPPRRPCPPPTQNYRSASRFIVGSSLSFSLMTAGSALCTYSAFVGPPPFHQGMSLHMSIAGWTLFALGYMYLNYMLVRLLNGRHEASRAPLTLGFWFGMFFFILYAAVRSSGAGVEKSVVYGLWAGMGVLVLVGVLGYGGMEDPVSGWESRARRERRREGLL